ncbi:Pyruvate/Phosphoenolpyruvate kinase-like domain-containing protein [Aspergillus falconensis]
MTSIARNNLQARAFGIRLAPSPWTVQLARAAGFDALFLDLEHSVLSLEDTAQLCTTGLLAGITPFVRVPYQCGDGFVQRVLDAGAMGVIFPHIKDKVDARDAVRVSKYPPAGTRSMTGQLPQFGSNPHPHEVVIQESNIIGSTVFVMIETKSAVDNASEIAATEGIDVLLIGSNDLSIELGVPGQFGSQVYRAAVEKVASAAHASGKIFGFAGVYDNAEVHDWVVNKLGARFLLGQQDSGFIAKGAKECMAAIKKIHE